MAALPPVLARPSSSRPHSSSSFIRLVTPMISQPPINSIPEDLLPRFDNVFVAHHNAYNAGRLHTHQVPIEDFRKDPKKYLIVYGRGKGPETGFKVDEITIPVTGGVSEETKQPLHEGRIKVRIYTPVQDKGSKKDEKLPAYVNFHGGGWVFGDLETDAEFCKRVAVGARCVVFDVDYRLSPEYKFPIPVQDSWEAFLKIYYDKGASMRLDTSRFAIGGCSAGGHIAAVIAHLCRDHKVPLAYQLLNVPVTDLHSFDDNGVLRPECPYASYREMEFTAALPQARMSYFHNHFLPEPRGPVKSDPKTEFMISPIRAKSFAGLAPAFVLTAEMDPLRDEGQAYAEKMKQAGVEVKTHLALGCPHTVTALDGILEEGKEWNATAVRELKRVFWGE